MSSGGETPGIGGVKALPKPSQRAPRAWLTLTEQATVKLPKAFARTQQNRRRLRRIGGS